jgi:hypothetical protein
MTYCNARSLLPKIPSLINYAAIHNSHIIAVTETWLSSNIPSSLLSMPNYEVYRKDRTLRKGGGALIFVSRAIASKSLSVLLPECEETSKIDAVACQLPLASGESLGLLCIYRPPGLACSENSVMYDILTSFLSYNLTYNVIIGDFNFPDIIWPSSSCSAESEEFLTFVQENYLEQHVTPPTRRVSDSVLDLVLSSPKTAISCVQVNEELDTSDHSMIDFKIQTRPYKMNRKVWKRNLRRANWSSFRQLLTSADWNDIFNSNDIDRVWEGFLLAITSALDSVAPFQLISKRSFTSSSKVRTALRHKRRLWNILKKYPNFVNMTAYERSSAIAKREIINDTTERENHVIKDLRSKEFWAYINNRLFKQHNIDSISSTGVETDDPFTISCVFNEYFASIFAPNSDITAPNLPTDEKKSWLSSITVCSDDLLKTLKKLPSKTSVDNDGLSYKILKEGGNILGVHLTRLFSLSLNEGRIPKAWKVGIVTPIHKCGSKKLVSNYRPISVTSCCCRILERLVRYRIMEYLSTYNLINATQHGFVPQRSTETILLEYYDYVSDRVDNNMMIDTIFFDFAKAFDTIPHHKLIRCLQQHGINGKLLRWIISFLTNRQQLVRIGNAYSKALPVTSGVIQGSVLGPLFFNIFINNIDDVVKHSTILKYADDIRLSISAPKSDSVLLHSKLQHDIDNIAEWASDSGMALNANKCFYVTFGSSDHQRTYSTGGSTIVNKSDYKDLGITVSSPLSFNKHIDLVISRAYSRLGLIHKAFRIKSQTSILRLFKAFVRPIVEYSSLIWNPYTIRNNNRVERIQRHMCRMIPEVRNLPYHKQLSCLGLHSLQLRRQRYQLLFTFKIYRQLADVDFHHFFQIRKDKRTRGHKLTLIPKFAKNNYRLHFFTNSVVQLWNQLANDDIDALNLLHFKSRLELFFQKRDLW